MPELEVNIENGEVVLFASPACSGRSGLSIPKIFNFYLLTLTSDPILYRIKFRALYP